MCLWESERDNENDGFSLKMLFFLRWRLPASRQQHNKTVFLTFERYSSKWVREREREREKENAGKEVLFYAKDMWSERIITITIITKRTWTYFLLLLEWWPSKWMERGKEIQDKKQASFSSTEVCMFRFCNVHPFKSCPSRLARRAAAGQKHRKNIKKRTAALALREEER